MTHQSDEAGEVACSGVHGANRLASNSLLEGLVFGMRAAQSAVAHAGHFSESVSLPSIEDLEQGRPTDLDDPEKLRSSLRRLMWGKVGLVRSGDSLISASAQLVRWMRLLTKPFSSRAALEVKNMVQVARCIADAALWRESSVGAHYRSDFPEANRPGWRQHSQLLLAQGPISGMPSNAQDLVLATQEPVHGKAGKKNAGRS
jgi:L-aspartate oxidase